MTTLLPEKGPESSLRLPCFHSGFTGTNATRAHLCASTLPIGAASRLDEFRYVDHAFEVVLIGKAPDDLIDLVAYLALV